MDAAIKNVGGVSAVVEYDYTAKEPDELDLIKGAIINNIKQLPGGWWEGTLQSNGKTGMFPDNFVRVVDLNDENTVILRDKSTISSRRCKVIYSYVQVNDDELSLAVGDVIEFLGEVEEGWWRGRLKNKIGVFPSNFVKVIEPSPVFASKRPPLTTVNALGGILAMEPAVTNKNLIGAVTKNKTLSSSMSSASASHRLSFHNSKEDLLSSTLATTPASTITNNLSHSHQYTAAIATATATTTAATSTLTTATTASTILNNNTNNNNNNNNMMMMMMMNSCSNSNSNSLGNMLLSTAITATGAITASDDVAPILPPKPQREHCRVEFPYTPQNDDELELKVGDIIIIHSTELPDRGWWKGELRGKIGVFPDNFVKLIPATEVSPLNDSGHHQTHPQQTHRTAKSTLNNHHTTASTNGNNHLSSVAATAKAIIKKSGSASSGSTHSSHRKDSFGSRDSLNDILSETGLTSGNVAAQRKSLESKNFDLSNAHADAAARIALKKQQQHQQPDLKGYHINGTGNSNNIMASSELRKSTENVDEKNKTTPPPVLTKKPIIPNKKGSTVSSVAGNIFSGLKQKVKSVESKLTAAASHDAADGLSGSKVSPNSAVAGNMESNNVAIRRAATIEDGEFDRVERTSILTDVRAGRVKAPKRRLPSTSTGSAGESNNNTLYINGSGGGGGGGSGGGSGSDATHSDDQLKSDDNSTSDELLAKPKPREWEKKKAPWMEELKASQVKKKTSPNVDNHLIGANTTTIATSSTTAAMATSAPTTCGSNVGDRISKLFNDDGKMISSSTTTNVVNSHTTGSSSSGSGSLSGSGNNMKTQQNFLTDDKNKSSSSNHNSSDGGHFNNMSSSTSSSANKPHTDSMNKSLSAKFGNDTIVGTANGNDDTRIRPNSLSLRNRSLSPSMAVQRTKQQQQQQQQQQSQHHHQLNSSSSPGADNIGSSGKVSSSGGASPFNNILNHHHNQQQQTNTHSHPHHQQQQHQHQHHHHQQQQQNYEYENNVGTKSDILRVNELESRVDKLEMVVNAQQRTIDELVRALREETDRVKILRGELDKYAQCVTQV